jgi:thymidine kinase
VICYGLKTDFQTNLFEGSKRLLELADVVKELEVVCKCGRKAIINARLDAMGNVITAGDVVDCGMHYESMCYHCYNRHTNGED